MSLAFAETALDTPLPHIVAPDAAVQATASRHMEDQAAIYNAIRPDAPHFQPRPGDPNRWQTDFTVFSDNNLPHCIVAARQQARLRLIK